MKKWKKYQVDGTAFRVCHNSKAMHNKNTNLSKIKLYINMLFILRRIFLQLTIEKYKFK